MGGSIIYERIHTLPLLHSHSCIHHVSLKFLILILPLCSYFLSSHSLFNYLFPHSCLYSLVFLLSSHGFHFLFSHVQLLLPPLVSKELVFLVPFPPQHSLQLVLLVSPLFKFFCTFLAKTSISSRS